MSNASGTVAAAVPTQREGLRSGRLGHRCGELEAWARERMAVIGAVAVASVAVLAFEFAFPTRVDAAAMRATVETVIALVAGAAAWLLRAQFAQSRRMCELLVAAALLAVGLVHLCWQAVPAALDLHSPNLFSGAEQVGALMVAGLFAAAALVGPERMMPEPNRLVRPAAITVGVTVSSGLIAFIARSGLVGQDMSQAAGVSGAANHPLAVAIAIVGAGLLIAATVGVLYRGGRDRDGVTALLAAGLIVLVGAQLSYVAVKTVPADRLAPHDALVLIGVSLMLAAAIRQEMHARRTLARAAALAERQRVARDLHDGLAQDLAFIAAHGERIAMEMGSQHPVVIAARRALAVSRDAIAELSGPHTSMHDALAVLAHELRERFEISIAVEVDATADLLSLRTQEDINRITREAIANAAQHGNAKNVIVSLTKTRDVHRLRIRDDGCGIESVVRTAPHAGLGLRSISERAEAAGGCMSIRQPGKRGTELEVMLP